MPESVWRVQGEGAMEVWRGCEGRGEAARRYEEENVRRVFKKKNCEDGKVLGWWRGKD